MDGKTSSRPTPSYSLRESGRAKRVLLRIRAGRGLEVVVPRGYDPARVPDIVRARLDWIEKATDRMRGLGLLRDPEELDALPAEVAFQASGERFILDYRQAARLGARITAPGQAVISGPLTDNKGMAEALRRLVRLRGAAHLPDMLGRVSRECGLSGRGVAVRMQRTRWGSCSSRGTISLNAKLMFLSPDLVRYVMVHELCHTVHLNHSRAYWTLVAEKEPAFQNLEQRLRTANRHVPAWMLG